jgi:hypothetical protein
LFTKCLSELKVIPEIASPKYYCSVIITKLRCLHSEHFAELRNEIDLLVLFTRSSVSNSLSDEDHGLLGIYDRLFVLLVTFVKVLLLHVVQVGDLRASKVKRRHWCLLKVNILYRVESIVVAAL